MAAEDFDFQFHSDVPGTEDGLRSEAERRLRDLAKKHHDLIGAAVTLEEPAANRTSPFVYRARVVVFMRPDNIAGEEKADTPQAALKGALDAVTRQVREEREKLRTRWKQP